MSTGILISARLESTRLRRKHLLKVNEVPILSFLIKRIKNEFLHEIISKKIKIIISTSKETKNKELELFKQDGVSVFYGSINNIPLRLFQTAEEYQLENIISIDGDDIFCSPNGMRCVLSELKKGYSYIMTSGLPFGMNSFGFSRSYLKSSLIGHEKDILETGWGQLFSEDDLVKIETGITYYDKRLRFTLDYPEDFKFFKSSIKGLGDNILSASDEEIIQFVKKKKIYLKNVSVMEEYNRNFNQQLNQQIITKG